MNEKVKSNKKAAFTLAESFTHISLLPSKTKGFTLAEVLITLGIIGVVAAMTIPTLIANTNSAKFRSQFKKSLSTLNQAVLMNEANFDVNFANAVACGGETYTPGDLKFYDGKEQNFCDIMANNLAGISYRYTFDGLDYDWDIVTITRQKDSDVNVFTLADGSIVALPDDSGDCTLYGRSLNDIMDLCAGFIDVNGLSKPNKEVRCSTGNTSTDFNEECSVNNNDVTDIFPVVFHDSTVEPATNAARYVLNTAK